jgi:integrase
VASIETKVINGKPMHRARWRDPAGKSRRSKWYERKLDANRHRAQVETDLHRGAYVDMSNTTTVAEYARRWMAARPLRPSTRELYALLLSHYIEAMPLGSRPLVKVRPSEVQVWATALAQRLAPYTLRIQIGVVRSIFASAVLDGLIARSPVQPANRLSLPKMERQPVVPLTVAQVRSLAAEMPGRYRAMVITQAGLGLRVGELLALRACDVNFLRRDVRVEEQISVRGRLRVPPKTPGSRRTVPLPSVVAEALAQHIAAFPSGSDGSLFTSGTGLPLGRSFYGDLFRTAVARASLPVGTSSHDLRHHYASVLLHAGESVHAIAERLGHVDAQLVLTTYGHLMPDQEDRTRRVIDEAWSAPADGRIETG